MIVYYSQAHSDPNRGPGRVSLSGISEREYAARAMESFGKQCQAAGYRFSELHGPLSPVVRLLKRKIEEQILAGNRYASIELHFNNTPWTTCHRCRQQTFAGVDCASCGAPPKTKWKLGPTAMVSRWSKASYLMAESIIRRLQGLMPWARRRTPIKMPDARYGRKIWPQNVIPPAVLVEAGFGCDKRFSDFIADKEGQLAIGRAVAAGVIDYCRKNKHVPLARWGL